MGHPKEVTQAQLPPSWDGKDRDFAAKKTRLKCSESSLNPVLSVLVPSGNAFLPSPRFLYVCAEKRYVRWRKTRMEQRREGRKEKVRRRNKTLTKPHDDRQKLHLPSAIESTWRRFCGRVFYTFCRYRSSEERWRSKAAQMD